MAPTQTGVTDADMGTILNALASCEELSLNSKKFAESEGISRADNASVPGSFFLQKES